MPVNISESYSLSMSQSHSRLSKTRRMQKKPPPRTFWGRLKEALKEAKKPTTQTFAAGFAQVTQPSVSLWNKPNAGPELATGVSLANRLNVCVEWLYTGRGPKHPGVPGDPHAEVLQGLWPQLSEETKRDLIGMARLKAMPKEDGPFPSDGETPSTQAKTVSAVPAS